MHSPSSCICDSRSSRSVNCARINKPLYLHAAALLARLVFSPRFIYPRLSPSSSDFRPSFVARVPPSRPGWWGIIKGGRINCADRTALEDVWEGLVFDSVSVRCKVLPRTVLIDKRSRLRNGGNVCTFQVDLTADFLRSRWTILFTAACGVILKRIPFEKIENCIEFEHHNFFRICELWTRKNLTSEFQISTEIRKREGIVFAKNLWKIFRGTWCGYLIGVVTLIRSPLIEFLGCLSGWSARRFDRI